MAKRVIEVLEEGEILETGPYARKRPRTEDTNVVTRVANCRVSYIRPQYQDLREWMADPQNVYIGRQGIVFIDGKRFPPEPSPFMNPYRLKFGCTREEVCAKYETYIREKLRADPDLRASLLAMRGKTLGCWCAPQLCHGDVLRRIIEEEVKKEEGPWALSLASGCDWMSSRFPPPPPPAPGGPSTAATVDKVPADTTARRITAEDILAMADPVEREHLEHNVGNAQYVIRNLTVLRVPCKGGFFSSKLVRTLDQCPMVHTLVFTKHRKANADTPPILTEPFRQITTMEIDCPKSSCHFTIGDLPVFVPHLEVLRLNVSFITLQLVERVLLLRCLRDVSLEGKLASFDTIRHVLRIPALHALCLHNGYADCTWAREIAAHGKHLTRLQLHGAPIRNAGAEALARGCPALIELQITNGRITEHGARAIARGLPRLTKLSLSGSRIQDRGAVEVATMEHLTVVDLSWCHIGIEGAAALGRSPSPLVEMHLRGNVIGWRGAREAMQHPNLRLLTMDSNGVNDPEAFQRTAKDEYNIDIVFDE